MATDLGAITAKIGADAGPYIAAFKASEAAVKSFAATHEVSITQAKSALRSYSRAADESTDTLKKMGVGAIAAAAAVIKFGSAVMDAAAVMNPSGAEEWNASLVKVDDAWIGLAGTIADVVRPALEGVADSMAKAIHGANTPELKNHLEDVKTAAGEVWDKFGEGLHFAKDKMGEFATFSMDKLAELGGLATHSDVVAEEAARRAVRNAAAPPPPPETEEPHHVRAAEIQAQNESQLRTIQEQVKAERLRAENAATVYEKAKQAVEVQKNGAQVTASLADVAAKSTFALSNQTTDDRMVMLRAEAASDADHSKAVAAADARAVRAAEVQRRAADVEVDAAQRHYNISSHTAEVAAAHATLTNINATAEEKAKADGVIATFTKQEAFQAKLAADAKTAQKDADEAHLTAVKDAGAAVISAAQKAADIQKEADEARRQAFENARTLEVGSAARRASAAGSTRAATLGDAQRAYDASIGSAGDKIALDDAQVAAAKDAAEWQIKGAEAEVRAAKQAQAIASDPEKAAEDLANAESKLKAARAAGTESTKNAVAQANNDRAAYERAPGQIVGQGLMGAGGAAGSLIGGAVQGGMAGGPAGALASVATTILTMSNAFKGFAGALNGILPLIANIGVPLVLIGNLFSPAGPLIAVATAFTLLAPLFTPLATSIQQVVTGLGSGFGRSIEQLGKLLGYLGTSLQRAAEIFDPVSEVMSRLVAAISNSVGPIIGKLGNGMVIIAEILNGALIPILPILQQGLTLLVEQLTGPFGTVIGTLFNAMTQFASFALNTIAGFSGAASTVITGIWQALNAIQKAGKSIGIDAGLGDAHHGIIGSLGDANQAFITAQQSAAGAASALANVTWNNLPPMVAFGAAVAAANQQLTNLPTAFSVATAYNQALAAGSAIAAGTFSTQLPASFQQNSRSQQSAFFGSNQQAWTDAKKANDQSFQNEQTAHDQDRAFRRTLSTGDGVHIENVYVYPADFNDFLRQLRAYNARQGNGATTRSMPRTTRLNLEFGMG